MTPKSVMVLGAGLAGIGAARRALESGFEVTVYEKADDVGGLWYYREDPNQVCVYKGIQTNQPKEINQLPDFFLKDQDKDYFSAQEMQEYYKAYSIKHGVQDKIEFNCEVVNIRPLKDKGDSDKEWEITVKNVKTGDIKVSQYDFVAICNGHYYRPIEIVVKGQELFQGEQIHSVKFRKAEDFIGKRVLIVGSGVSALDMGCLLANQSIPTYLSQRCLFNMDQPWPEKLTISPVVQQITEKGAIFVDGSSCEVDLIIYATGYRYDFPFLSPECGIVVEEEHIQDLYKHIFNIKYPSMALIGMPFMVLTSLLFDMQSRYVMKVWSGEKPLPSKEEMLEESQKQLEIRLELGWPKKQAHKMSILNTDYQNDLADSAGVKRYPPVFRTLTRTFLESASNNYLSYRKQSYEILNDEEYRTFFK